VNDATRLGLRARAHEFWYWHGRRPLGRLGWWALFKVPRRGLYWAVVRAAVIAEPNSNPSGVTADEMLKALEGKGER
jgi:hypothetical protein